MILTPASVIEGIPESLETRGGARGGWWSRFSPRDLAVTWRRGGRSHSRVHLTIAASCRSGCSAAATSWCCRCSSTSKITLLNNNFAAALCMLLLVLSVVLLYRRPGLRVRGRRDRPLILRLTAGGPGLPEPAHRRGRRRPFGSDKIARFPRRASRSAGSASAVESGRSSPPWQQRRPCHPHHAAHDRHRLPAAMLWSGPVPGQARWRRSPLAPLSLPGSVRVAMLFFLGASGFGLAGGHPGAHS